MNLVQLQHSILGRRVGLVKEPHIVLLDPSIGSCYQFFTAMIEQDTSIRSFLDDHLTRDSLLYDPIYEFKSDWHLLSPVDCPANPAQCMLSGTGLTHKASAANRQKMHESQLTSSLTDSMKMYMMGDEGGKPAAGEIGVQPEWFYKGNGSNLKGHSEPLLIPNYADDGGDEPEVAGIYLISSKGVPHRLGFVQANEFSDHIMEKKNYLYLAPSKIRNCAIGPELILDISFDSIPGKVTIVRGGKELWSKQVRTGEDAMSHTLANLEYHHFKYDQHRIPGQLHIHFFGADAFSFGENISLQDSDEMHISFQNMGRPLINPVQFANCEEEYFSVQSLRL